MLFMQYFIGYMNSSLPKLFITFMGKSAKKYCYEEFCHVIFDLVGIWCKRSRLSRILYVL
jgi:hypothetical protein